MNINKAIELSDDILKKVSGGKNFGKGSFVDRCPECRVVHSASSKDEWNHWYEFHKQNECPV